MKKILTFLLTACFALTDTISVYVFFYSNMYSTFAICSLGYLFYNVYQKQYSFFEKFVHESSFNDFSIMPSPMWVINTVFFFIACAFVFLQLAAQLFSIVVFFQAQLSGFYAPGLIPLIIGVSACSNLIKFRADVIDLSLTFKTYIQTWIVSLTKEKLLISYLLFRLLTAFAVIYLSYFSYCLAYNSITYLLAHTQLFAAFAGVFNRSLVMNVFVSLPLALMSVKSFMQFLIRIDIAVYSKLHDHVFSKTFISPSSGIKSVATACIKTIAASRVSSLANSFVMCTNIINELDDLNYPEVDREIFELEKAV